MVDGLLLEWKLSMAGSQKVSQASSLERGRCEDIRRFAATKFIVEAGEL